MGLKLYNTLTRTKEVFDPIDPDNVRMYVCGPTVYDFAHIGNARPLIVFDVLYRLLKHLYPGEGNAPDGSRVTYVRNITDVEDKINARAAADFPDLPLNEAINKVTTRTTEQFHADVAALGCLEPTIEPRATEYIDRPDASTDMIRLIGQLIDKGYAYPAEGHVLFDVKSWKAADGSAEYGKLSRRSLDDMIAGARVEVAPYKKDPMDFVLWKPSRQEARSGATGTDQEARSGATGKIQEARSGATGIVSGEPGWDSPWGFGRPGWHLECSAMAGALLGETFDIHGGGIDLVFPHHENEIAQSRCAHGTDTMARVWMHNGFLQVEGEKMSKSAGNFVTIRDLLEGWEGYAWPGEALRFNMLRTHYRQPIDWTLAGLEESHRTLWDWYGSLDGVEQTDEVPTGVVEALSDDLNTPAAIAALHKVRKSGDFGSLLASLRFLGFCGARSSIELVRNINVHDTIKIELLDEAIVMSLVAARAAARAAKDWGEADRIRAELDGMGVVLKDAKDPETGELVTTWEVKR